MDSRFFLDLSFRGTAFYGWQIQPKKPTVQQTVSDALSTVLMQKITLTGAGRTDTGVHAKHFFAHFDADEQTVLKDQKLLYRLNGILDGDIVVHAIYRAIPEAHARFSALSRTYQYTIARRKDPFNRDFVYHYSGPLNVEEMNAAARILLEYEDFTSFSKLHSQTATNICKVMDARWDAHGDQLVFTIRADRFLHNMVRAIVGTLILVGSGKLSATDVHPILKGRNRSLAGPSAPACGLTLIHIEYPDGLMVAPVP
jgi:tRNA pseudouridine38-40 synthase